MKNFISSALMASGIFLVAILMYQLLKWLEKLQTKLPKWLDTFLGGFFFLLLLTMIILAMRIEISCGPGY